MSPTPLPATGPSERTGRPAQARGSDLALPPGSAIRIGLVAGEASGDQLGAGLVHALRERFPDAQFAGIAGDRMRAAGVDAWFDASELAVMGLAEVLAHLPRLLRLRRAFRERMLDWQPDVFVGIDAPDFNLGVERWLKQRRPERGALRTVHYVSPSVWAWRESRAEKIGRSADRVLCLFPMEPPIYARHGVDARFVGHPLADALPLEPDRDAARASLGIAADAPVLAVLPGSRLGEIRRLGRIFLEAARVLATQVPGLQLVVPAANAACRTEIEALRKHDDPPLRVLDGDAQRAMIAADAVLLASGTAALEAMLCKRPMVVAYRLAPTSYAIVRTLGLLKVERVSLPNVLAGEALVPELLQHDCTPDKLAGALLPYFRDSAVAAALQPRFRELHLQLRQDASARAADAIAELLTTQ